MVVSLEEAKREDDNEALLKERTRCIHSATFNVNIYAELEYVTKFRFKKQDIGVICATVNWDPEYTTHID